MAVIQSQAKSTETIIEACELKLQSIITKFNNYRLYSRTISELNALTARELTDLGLSRSMIRSAAYSAVYKGQDYRKDNI